MMNTTAKSVDEYSESGIISTREVVNIITTVNIVLGLLSAFVLCVLWKSKNEIRRRFFNPTREVLLQNHAADKWTAIRQIGAGTYGLVKLVHNASTSEICVRKEITLQNSDNAKLPSAKMEFEILKKLNHPNVVRIFKGEVSKDGNYFYIYMELAESGTLKEMLKTQGTIQELKTKDYVRQILNALKYIHSVNVIHRDIKPDNILVFNGHIVKLADFGVSRLFEKLSISTTVVGTPLYVAKEVLKGKYGRKCDIWSLGVVIFEMVTGELPWENKNINAIMCDISVHGLKPDVDSMHVSMEMKEFLKPMFLEENERPSADDLLKNSWLETDVGILI